MVVVPDVSNRVEEALGYRIPISCSVYNIGYVIYGASDCVRASARPSTPPGRLRPQRATPATVRQCDRRALFTTTRVPPFRLPRPTCRMQQRFPLRNGVILRDKLACYRRVQCRMVWMRSCTGEPNLCCCMHRPPWRRDRDGASMTAHSCRVLSTLCKCMRPPKWGNCDGNGRASDCVYT